MIICDLLTEEQRLKYLHQPILGSFDMILITSGRRNLFRVQCFTCKKFGHLVTTCRDNPMCTYCKNCVHLFQDSQKHKRVPGKALATLPLLVEASTGIACLATSYFGPLPTKCFNKLFRSFQLLV